MGGVTVEQRITKSELDNDRRDVKDLWAEALRAYKGVLGRDLRRAYRNIDDMVANGVEQMNNFHKWRHNEKKVDKLRTLFTQNIDLIGTGAQKLADAASSSFPPAAAIGTAMTFILAVRDSLGVFKGFDGWC